jgi:L-lactate dehydrogenase (cytochrome)/(S)-mandelate dehydrogenase
MGGHAALDGRARPQLHALSRHQVNIDKAVNIADLRLACKRRLPRIVFDYIDGGAEDEIGLAENMAAFARHKLIPRFFTDCGSIDLATKLFGKPYSLPFGIAPTGIAGLFRPGGDLLLAEAALAESIPYVMSGTANAPIESLRPDCARNAWYQLYTGKDKAIDEDIVRRAADAGIETLVLTVDSEVRTKRERDIRNAFGQDGIKTSVFLEALLHPAWLASYFRTGRMPVFGNFAPYAANGKDARAVRNAVTTHLPGNPVWSDLERYRRLWKGNLVVKGILHPDDAVRSVELGADGIIVSNHGGRQLDRCVASIDMLPPIRAAIGDRATLMLDSGVRRGSDVITALCLGAEFVFVGRATLYGLSAAGLPGVRKAIGILRQEIETVGRQIGCGRATDFGPQCLKQA